MQWWNEFVSWFESSDGQRVITTAVIPFVAILLAGIIAALIARGSAKRVLAYQDREMKAAAVMALIGAGRKAVSWSSLGGAEKQHADNLISDADIRVRLLPVNGTNAAADWAAHELDAMKKNSANYSFQAEQTFVEYRNRLLEWQSKPKRARKLFAFDLEQWRYDDEAAEKARVEKQRQWAAQQEAEAAPVTPAVQPALAPPIVPATSRDTTPATTADDAQNDAPATAYAAPAVTTALPPTDSATSDTDEPHTNFESADHTPDTVDDSVNVDDTASDADDYAPPVTAGTVRRRTDPDPVINDDRGTV
jgi:hypothetical protein